MKSHSHIPTTNHKELAQKINRSGLVRLFHEELVYLEANLVEIAGLCQPERAKAVFEHFGRVLPEGFVCDPVVGEMDALVGRLKAATDKKNAEG